MTPWLTLIPAASELWSWGHWSQDILFPWWAGCENHLEEGGWDRGRFGSIPQVEGQPRPLQPLGCETWIFFPVMRGGGPLHHLSHSLHKANPVWTPGDTKLMFVSSLCTHPPREGFQKRLRKKWTWQLVVGPIRYADQCVGGTVPRRRRVSVRHSKADRETPGPCVSRSSPHLTFTANPTPGPPASLTLAGAGSSSRRSLAQRLPWSLAHSVLCLTPPGMASSCSSTDFLRSRGLNWRCCLYKTLVHHKASRQSQLELYILERTQVLCRTL